MNLANFVASKATVTRLQMCLSGHAVLPTVTLNYIAKRLSVRAADFYQRNALSVLYYYYYLRQGYVFVVVCLFVC